MKHASSTTIESLAPLLQKIRLLPELKEKKPGVFYRKSRAFLHFHEDDGRIYADVRLDGSDFQRLPCSSARDQAALITTIRSRVL
jgi:hypothetical protein